MGRTENVCAPGLWVEEGWRGAGKGAGHLRQTN